jgi:hypothetical protein
MERREAPGVCETPWGIPCDRDTQRAANAPALRGPSRPVVRTGLRVPSRGARVPQRQACEACRPDAAPPGAPPRRLMRSRRASIDTPAAPVAVKREGEAGDSVNALLQAGITFFRRVGIGEAADAHPTIRCRGYAWFVEWARAACPRNLKTTRGPRQGSCRRPRLVAAPLLATERRGAFSLAPRSGERVASRLAASRVRGRSGRVCRCPSPDTPQLRFGVSTSPRKSGER